MESNVELVVLLVILWSQSSKSQNVYHANVITRNHLCTIPSNNGMYDEILFPSRWVLVWIDPIDL